jgi:dimethylglycine dehydrogenase
VLAEWITEGQTEWDMWSCDPRRFTDYTDHDYCVAKGMEVYGHEYAMHFPHHEWPAGRDKKLSPLHDRCLRRWARVMGAYNGWERANWFAKPGDDTSEEAPRPGTARSKEGPGSRASARNARRCAIIGGGVSGCSVAYHLAKLGWSRHSCFWNASS